ncbi:MAG TPA: leucine--tRNA ligase, partial [Fimbriimonas sp.]|nr:leucine--tRNA ligase [Fimbriimonas sp.]
RRLAAVNWCPKDKTALANEEVVAGHCERCGTAVVKKEIPQWFFKITDYADRLIDDLETIDWPEGIKMLQRNWIGRSEGVQFRMEVALGVGRSALGGYDLDAPLDPQRPTPNAKRLYFEVFTTRIDTVFGMTFCVLAPEHALVEEIVKLVPEERQQAIRTYQQQANTLSDTDRQVTTREKTGVFTGAYAINPANGARVPIWLADYVLANYGTGAIMAVPGHDQRDFEFALKFGLDVIPVIKPDRTYMSNRPYTSYEEALEAYSRDVKAFQPVFESKDSTLMNSGEYTGLTVSEAQRALSDWMEGLGIGERKVQYKLRDWLISRQRYWGCPIPVIHTKDGEEQLVPENLLPVELPDVENYEPSGDGSSPLAHIPEWVNVTDLDGRLGRRETDTMGGFACSSWYFLRFCDPDNFEKAWDQAKVDYWMPVDCYVGGAEHAVMHLLYARFWTKVLYDEGLVKVKEPFAQLRNQGQVLALTPYRYPREGEQLELGDEGVLITFAEAKELPEEDVFYRWARMSKSKGNVVTPDEAVAEYGADALRMFLLFVAPFDADVNWKNEGMHGMVRFLSRVFKLVEDLKPTYVSEWRDYMPFEELDDKARAIRRATHQTIRNCTGDIERFSFNTYVSWLQKYVNALYDGQKGEMSRAAALAFSEAIEVLILLLSPGAPHTADELWNSIGKDGFTIIEKWPTHSEELAAEELLTIAVQVNGKLRDTFQVAPEAGNEEHERLALASAKVQVHLEGKTIRKIIVVPGRLVNIVAN